MEVDVDLIREQVRDARVRGLDNELDVLRISLEQTPFEEATHFEVEADKVAAFVNVVPRQS